MKTLLHIGCGNVKYPGFINTDKNEMDIRRRWPYEDNSVDGIVSMAVFQCLTWKELMKAFREAYRVLKPGCYMRMGVNLVETNYPLDKVLYGHNINLFSFSLLENILVKRIGFKEMRYCWYQDTRVVEFAEVDRRFKRGSSFLEVEK